MKNLKSIKFIIALSFVGFLIGCQSDPIEEIVETSEVSNFQKATPIEGQYIVVYNDATPKMSRIINGKNNGNY